EEIFFIVRGEVEVIDEAVLAADPTRNRVKTRLGKGMYFGEVAGLNMAPRRTATVRSVSFVESVVIGGQTIREVGGEEGMRESVEKTARGRLEDVEMGGMGGAGSGGERRGTVRMVEGSMPPPAVLARRESMPA